VPNHITKAGAFLVRQRVSILVTAVQSEKCRAVELAPERIRSALCFIESLFRVRQTVQTLFKLFVLGLCHG
jgi:hypothetical protein